MRAGWQGIGQREVVFRGLEQGPGARFSKVPTLFGHVSGDIILFVSSKWRRLEARNFAVSLIFIPFTTYEKTSFTESAGRSSRNGFSGPNGFRDFRETGPSCDMLMRPNKAETTVHGQCLTSGKMRMRTMMGTPRV